MEKKKIGVRDLVNVGIFTVLNYALFYVTGVLICRNPGAGRRQQKNKLPPNRIPFLGCGFVPVYDG